MSKSKYDDELAVERHKNKAQLESLQDQIYALQEQLARQNTLLFDQDYRIAYLYKLVCDSTRVLADSLENEARLMNPQAYLSKYDPVKVSPDSVEFNELIESTRRLVGMDKSSEPVVTPSTKQDCSRGVTLRTSEV